MRDLSELEQYAFQHPVLGGPVCYGGAYMVPSPRTATKLAVIASCAPDTGWDHVSVSLPHRCPNWHEMELVKRTFFRDDEWAMQLHAPPAKHISLHPNCLHLWRPHGKPIPIPPEILV